MEKKKTAESRQGLGFDAHLLNKEIAVPPSIEQTSGASATTIISIPEDAKTPVPSANPPGIDLSGSDDVVNAKLREINQLISPYQLAYVHPKHDCILLDRNARYMTKTQQERLTANIKQDGFLSQLPFAIRIEATGKYRILSGNHRIMSAIAAGLERVLILYGEEKDYDPQKQLALQLSHNAVSGQDDQTVLKALYMDIESVLLKAYTGVDEEMLKNVSGLNITAINDTDIPMYELRFLFTGSNKQKVEQCLDRLESTVSVNPDSDVLVFMDEDWFISLLSKIQKKYNIKNRSASMLKLCQIVDDHLNHRK